MYLSDVVTEACPGDLLYCKRIRSRCSKIRKGGMPG